MRDDDERIKNVNKSPAYFVPTNREPSREIDSLVSLGGSASEISEQKSRKKCAVNPIDVVFFYEKNRSLQAARWKPDMRHCGMIESRTLAREKTTKNRNKNV